MLPWDGTWEGVSPKDKESGVGGVSSPTSRDVAWLAGWWDLGAAGVLFRRDSQMMYSPTSDTATVVAASNDMRTFWKMNE